MMKNDHFHNEGNDHEDDEDDDDGDGQNSLKMWSSFVCFNASFIVTSSVKCVEDNHHYRQLTAHKQASKG